MNANRLNLLLGVVIAILAAVVVADRIGAPAGPALPVFAQPGGAGGDWLLGTTGNYNSSGPFCLWLFNTSSNKLLLYQFQGNQLRLMFVRDVRFESAQDLEEWTAVGNRQMPSVAEIRKETKKK